MSNAPATHFGHCQACGRRQKLPNGLLAKHGYTVAAGYFSGVCVGSGRQPFEESYDMLPGFIASAQKELARLEGIQAKWTANTEPTVMVHNYEAKIYTYGNDYKWRKVELVFEERPAYSGGTYVTATYMAPGTSKSAWEIGVAPELKSHKLETYSLFTREAIIAEMNRRYVAAVEPACKDLRRYIAWQENRIATWTRQELMPVDVKAIAKDEKKVEFKPTAEGGFAE